MKWPDKIRCAVSLTFDVDGEVLWLSKVSQNPAFGNPVVRSLGDFGPRVGVPRILELLAKYEIKACFFIPGQTMEKYPKMVKEISDFGHEIGFHSYAHLNPASMTLEEEKKDFEKGLELFERTIQKRPLGYRSPALEMSQNTWNLLAAYGFLYDSAMMGADFPYFQPVAGKHLVEIPIHWMLDDWVYFGFNMYPSLPYMSGISSQEKVYEIWSAEFDGMYEAGCHFVLCMHPQIMGRLSRLNMLERLIRHIQEKPDVWIAKPIEVARHLLACQESNA
jgi:peptidoglycan/xylan/chitin deacetylase (PgdA/CDA1 family)